MGATSIRFSLLLLPALAIAAEPVDWIVTARHVITMNAARQIITGGAVAIRGSDIVAAGARADIENAYTPRERLDRPDALLMPGLINTHTHAPMSLLRGIADDLRLQDWLQNFIFPAEARNVTPDFVRWGTRLACLEMMLSGTTTYTDMYYFEDTIAEATKEAGMRAVLGETIIGFPAPDHKTPAESLAAAEKFMVRFKGDPLIVPAVAPHAIYTNSAETLKAARALADRQGLPLLIHLSETEKENLDCMREHQASPTRYLDSLGALQGWTIAAHAVFTNAADWAILAQRKTGIGHCPSSNMKLASGVAPVVQMLRAGIPVGLGPDGPAGSNNDFNLFEEMDLAAKLAKVWNKDPQVLSAQTAVEMATILGAKAIGLDRQIGSIEPGKRADLITVSLEAPNAVPEHDPYSMLVYTLKGANVEDVMIHGRWTVRGRRALTLNAPDITAKAEALRRKVEESLRKN
jgi:5-methylthioadenosine/S-adenosylhomocysteine deaminase